MPVGYGSPQCDACYPRQALPEELARRMVGPDGRWLHALPCWTHRRLVWVSDYGDYLPLSSYVLNHLTRGEGIR